MKTETEIKVRGYHLDVFSHVNNARYLEFLEEARWASFEDLGISFSIFTEKGWGLAVVNINITYKAPANLGKTLRITTELEKFGVKSITLKQRIFIKETGAEAVEADIKFVVFDLGTGRSVPVTDEMKAYWSPVGL
jgi:thioesterase-3